LVAIFLTLWFTSVALFAIVSAILSSFSTNAVFLLLASLAMLAAVGVLYAYLCQMASGARRGESENQFLLRFLLRTLAAEEVVRH